MDNPWRLRHRACPICNAIAKRHYSCQSPDSPQFVKPGRCVVLLAAHNDALWVSSAPFAQYVRHAWAGCWECSLFRSEGAGRASDLITAAVAATRWVWGDPPPGGMITFINRAKVRPTRVHGADVWGWTYERAGWRPVGETAGGLLCLQLLPAAMPPPALPGNAQPGLFEAATGEAA